MERKYELTNETREVSNLIVHRIKAVRDFGHVRAGDLGGFVYKEENLSHEGNCWIFDNAMVHGKARVYGNAEIRGDARVIGSSRVSGNAVVKDEANVNAHAWVNGKAIVCGKAVITDKARIGESALVCCVSRVFERARVRGHAEIHGGKIKGDALVDENAVVFELAEIRDHARVYGNAWVTDYVEISGKAEVHGDARLYDKVEVGGNADVRGCAIVRDNASIGGDADVFGDVCLFGNTMVKDDAQVCYSAYVIIKNSYTPRCCIEDYFLYTHNNRRWHIGGESTTGEELVKEAYKVCEEKGRYYEATVKYVETIFAMKDANKNNGERK